MFPIARSIPLVFFLTAALAPPCRGEGVPRVEFKRELAVTGKYLILPVANNRQNRSRITVTVDGRLVHRLECDFPPDSGSIDWWTYLEMGDYTGKTATITGNAPAGIPGLFEASDELRDLAPLYDEALRPQLRFSQMRGWNNDPNGLLYHDGEYHFFWQCNPGGWEWANMYWGHAVSTDLVHWTELDRALRPFGGGDPNRHPNMFGANAQYAVGRFDGRNFTPEHDGLHRVHYGNYYASQCFSNAPGGRVIQIGWTREFPIPGMPFNQAFSLPTELTLRTTPDGLRLFAYPIKELEQLRRPEPKVLAGRKLTAAEPSAEVESGELTVESLAVHTMKSIWKPNHP